MRYLIDSCMIVCERDRIQNHVYMHFVEKKEFRNANLWQPYNQSECYILMLSTVLALLDLC